MQVEEKITRVVTLNEADLIDAVVMLLKSKSYNNIKAEDIVINPTSVTAICTIEYTNKTT